MTVRDLLDLAKVTSLGSYAMKDDDGTLIKILNFSLGQVYNRIPVLTQTQNLPLKPDKTRYEYLSSSYKVLSALTDCGRDVALNDDLDRFSIFDIGNHVIDVPICVQKEVNSLVLLLQMKPPKITCENIDTTEFTPDDALAPAILSHMAYMVSKNISEENGVGHFNDFVQAIDEVKRLGMFTSYHHSRTHVFKMNGWT